MKEVFVVRNLVCNSMEQEQTSKPYNHQAISVTVVCGTELFMVRFCLYPNLIVDFSQIYQDIDQIASTEDSLTLTISGTNSVIPKVIPIQMHLKNVGNGMSSIFYIIILFCIVVVIVSILFLQVHSGKRQPPADGGRPSEEYLKTRQHLDLRDDISARLTSKTSEDKMESKKKRH